MTQMKLSIKKNRLTDMENRLVVAKAGQRVRERPSRQAARGRWWPWAAQSWSPGPGLRSGFLCPAQSRQR